MNPPAPILHDFMNLWQVKKQITLDEALPTMVDLLLPKQQVEEHIIPHLSAQSRDILRSRRRTKKVDIPVYDDDIGEGFEGSTELELEKSGGEYFLANWTHVIMRRRAMRGRQIQAGDYLVMNFRSDGKTLDGEQQATGSSNHPSTNKELWKSVWKLGVQPKIKNFRWRSTRNLLPAQANLFKKVVTHSICRICENYAKETGSRE
ncbi:hypothetical protein Peur_033209 [Populus x canadensis]